MGWNISYQNRMSNDEKDVFFQNNKGIFENLLLEQF